MTVKQFMNAMGQKPLKGELCAVPNPSTISAQIYPSSTDTLYAGSAVKLISAVSKTVLVDLCGSSNSVFGFIIYNPKKNVYTAGDIVEIALPGSVLYLEAREAISRGNILEYHPTGSKVIISNGTNPVCGIALDDASGDEELLRVLVQSVFEESSSSSSSSLSSSSSCRSSSSSSSSRSSSSSSSKSSSSSSSSRSSSSSSSSCRSSSSSSRSSSSSSSSCRSSSSSSRSSSSSSSSKSSSSSSSSSRSSSSSSSSKSSSSSSSHA
jgi:hypothetical protein